MVNRKAATYSLLWLLGIVVLVVGLGLLSWQANSQENGRTVGHCSILLQYCGKDARISIKEMLYLWSGWALLPTIVFLGFVYQQARSKDIGGTRPSLLWFVVAIAASMVFQSFIAFQLWGVRYYVNDFVRPSVVSDVSFFGFLSGFFIISLLTVGLLALILASISSGLQKSKSKPIG